MNDRSISIRPATPDDLADIQALILALAEYERLSHLCVATSEQLADALLGPRPAAEVQIARIDGDSGPAVGFALFCHTFSTFLGRRTLWLEDLYVRQEHRGRGVGRALLRRLASIARERGCGRFEWAVLDWNAPSIRFYEGLGARLMDDWTICRVTGDALDRLAEAPDA